MSSAPVDRCLLISSPAISRMLAILISTPSSKLGVWSYWPVARVYIRSKSELSISSSASPLAYYIKAENTFRDTMLLCTFTPAFDKRALVLQVEAQCPFQFGQDDQRRAAQAGRDHAVVSQVPTLHHVVGDLSGIRGRVGHCLDLRGSRAERCWDCISYLSARQIMSISGSRIEACCTGCRSSISSSSSSSRVFPCGSKPGG